MKRDEGESVKDIVFRLLSEKKASRDDDHLLIHYVLVELGFAYIVRNGVFIPFKHICDLPSYETITRVRRRIQEDCPELRGSRVVEEFRRECELEMRDIFVSGEGFGRNTRQLCLL